MEIVVRANAADLERVEQVLEAGGALAVTYRAAGDDALFDEPNEASPVLWQSCEVVGLFDGGIDQRKIEDSVRRVTAATVEVTSSELVDQPWSTMWMDRFRPMRFGKDLWICPSWHESSDPTATVVRLDPGMAFGTGTHETTALCLEWIADHGALSGASVLDFGCGSGILAIAAAKRGASRVVAVDIDPAARASARLNSRLNTCESIEVLAPEALPPVEFDILMANILARPLIELASPFAGRLRPRGALVLSGILRDEASAVLAAYAAQFKMDSPTYRGEWVRLTGRRGGPP